MKHLILSFFILFSVDIVAQIHPIDLKCEYLTNPEGIDMQNPRLFWQLKSTENVQYQTAYQIIVASSKDNIDKNIGDVYDSKKVTSSQSIQIVYKGRKLNPATAYFWKVRVWDKNKKVSEWSEPATFSTGLFSVDDWKDAQWIAWRNQDEWVKEWWRKKEIESQCTEFRLPSYFGARMNLWERYNFYHDSPYDPAPLLRKKFNADKKVKSARAFISGIGYYELYVNGKKIGNQVLDPGWTDYRKTILYATHDISKEIISGNNAVGIMLGRGFYGQLAYDHWGFYKKNGYVGQPKLMCRIKIEYTDGTSKDVISDLSWKITGGPVVYDGPHMGEIYDATKEIKDWNMASFDDSTWENVKPAPSPGGKLISQLCQPIRVTNTFHPVKTMYKGNYGTWFDAGTNLSGWVRLRIEGAKKGQRILVYFGENVEPSTIHQPGAAQQMAYIAKGDKVEYAECKFSYKGFRYFQVVGLEKVKLDIEDVEICEVHSDVPRVGQFYSSDKTINAVHEICRKSLIYNLHSIPTDCPHREKNGWLGDAVTGMEYGMANYDLAALITKFTRDIFDTQDALGGMSAIAPANEYRNGNSTLWSSAAVHLPWYMYNYYGDTRLFEKYWDKMMLWVNFSWKNNNSKEKDGMFSEAYNDWVPPYDATYKEQGKPGGNEVIASMNFYLVMKRMAVMAEKLGKKADKKHLDALIVRMHNGIQKWAFDEKKVEYAGLKPFSEFLPVVNILALNYDIVPEKYRAQLEKKVIDNIVIDKSNHLWGGVFTVHSAYEYFPKNGYADLMHEVVVDKTWPSFGWMIKEGATTLPEGYKFTSSNIHHFMGAVDNFFYRHMAGINTDPNGQGFQKILFKPNFIQTMDFAKASYNSIYGEIEAEWKKTGNRTYEYKVVVPTNCQAKVVLPGRIETINSGEYMFSIKI
ncbi:family 78 glycoside hydrolase catalytic domain [Siansivirga zeaxanthinifaciens]|uniref:alpha-L-rhamnosidase n=1 Tax=Siansivirga zeaxanthinifaciens CC-SAMT-1 TaxID=1454006 RepID=A0A0C5WBN3_9FLAO|nr:family 78 glycoside hydrolase catalytic domain [Siansivirga zeaxanthinifaciens]AJR04523.1 alpha-rhamnosidase [Siansivirga zeaxanthinifaciens CC-SAMT-1]